MKIEIKVGPPPAIRKKRVSSGLMADIVAAAKQMPKDSWFLVPGSKEFAVKGISARRRQIEIKLQDAKLDDCAAHILDQSEGGGIIVRRLPEFMESGKAAKLRAQKLGGA